MENRLQEVYDIIEQADYILIGCGVELSLDRLMKEEKEEFIYASLLKCEGKALSHSLFGHNHRRVCDMHESKCEVHNKEELSEVISENQQVDWFDNLLRKIRHYNYNENNNIYDKLYEIVKNKNYFIVTTNTDSFIYKSKFAKDRIVAPCGNELLLQCAIPCEESVWSSNEYMKDICSRLDEIVEVIHKKDFEQLKLYQPTCPKCGSLAAFNIRDEVKQYVEAGYMEQWTKYMAWLRNTLNKKIVMLELGESFLTPTVIRWPFEKNTFINNKAKLIRINEKFPQISQEIKDKSISIGINSTEFIEKIFLYQNQL